MTTLNFASVKVKEEKQEGAFNEEEQTMNTYKPLQIPKRKDDLQSSQGAKSKRGSSSKTKHRRRRKKEEGPSNANKEGKSPRKKRRSSAKSLCCLEAAGSSNVKEEFDGESFHSDNPESISDDVKHEFDTKPIKSERMDAVDGGMDYVEDVDHNVAGPSHSHSQTPLIKSEKKKLKRQKKKSRHQPELQLDTHKTGKGSKQKRRKIAQVLRSKKEKKKKRSAGGHKVKEEFDEESHNSKNPENISDDAKDEFDVKSIKSEKPSNDSDNETGDVADTAGPRPFQMQLTKAQMKRLKRRSKKLERANSNPCVFCSEAFETLGKLKRHLKLAHKTPIFVCSICDILFATNEDKVEHDTVNHRFECNFCPGWRVRRKNARDSHVRQVHGLKSTTCHVCGDTLKCYADVIPHLKCHEAKTGQRFIFQCEKCVKPHFFYTMEDMIDHMNINFHRTYGARKDLRNAR